MKLNTSLESFKKLHKNKKYNQAIYYSQNCKNYNFIEMTHHIILVSIVDALGTFNP